MNKFISGLLCAVTLSSSIWGAEPMKKMDEHWISIGTDSLPSISHTFGNKMKKMDHKDDIAIMKINASDVEKLSHLMHEEFHRCGGFVIHDSYQEAYQVMHGTRKRKWVNKHKFADYSIDQESVVEPMVASVDAEKIQETIEHLSSYHNRYYKSETGVQSMEWIKSKWEQLAGDRPDVTVELWDHGSFPQPSVIMTVQGTDDTGEIIVIGGHGDSIAGWWGGATKRAPGADDNASGIATTTEIIRLMMEHNYHPSKTVQFMAYAAEEVGLVGSSKIAKKYKADNKHVIGVLQLDMTNFKGTPDMDIVMMSDYTNAAQNTFVGQLIDKYVHVPWGYSKCGYGCSDHASWTRNGYPASMPHEATMDQGNKKIHTAHDLIDLSGGHAEHAAKFAKLGVAFMVELGK